MNFTTSPSRQVAIVERRLRKQIWMKRFVSKPAYVKYVLVEQVWDADAYLDGWWLFFDRYLTLINGRMI